MLILRVKLYFKKVVYMPYPLIPMISKWYIKSKFILPTFTLPKITIQAKNGCRSNLDNSYTLESEQSVTEIIVSRKKTYWNYRSGTTETNLIWLLNPKNIYSDLSHTYRQFVHKMRDKDKWLEFPLIWDSHLILVCIVCALRVEVGNRGRDEVENIGFIFTPISDPARSDFMVYCSQNFSPTPPH